MCIYIYNVFYIEMSMCHAHAVMHTQATKNRINNICLILYDVFLFFVQFYVDNGL